MNVEVFYNENGKTFQEIMEYFLIEMCDTQSADFIEKYA